jgi:hypothetical protein
VLSAYLRGVPVERMAWEPIGNGCIIRLQPQRGDAAMSPERNNR